MVSRQQIHLLGRARRGCLCQSRANRRPRAGTGSQLEGYEKNWSPGFVGRISARRISTDLALREQRGNLRAGSQSTLTRASALLDSNGANQVCWHYFRLAVTRPKTGFGFCEGLDPRSRCQLPRVRNDLDVAGNRILAVGFRSTLLIVCTMR